MTEKSSDGEDKPESDSEESRFERFFRQLDQERRLDEKHDTVEEVTSGIGGDTDSHETDSTTAESEPSEEQTVAENQGDALFSADDLASPSETDNVESAWDWVSVQNDTDPDTEPPSTDSDSEDLDTQSSTETATDNHTVDTNETDSPKSDSSRIWNQKQGNEETNTDIEIMKGGRHQSSTDEGSETNDQPNAAQTDFSKVESAPDEEDDTTQEVSLDTEFSIPDSITETTKQQDDMDQLESESETDNQDDEQELSDSFDNMRPESQSAASDADKDSDATDHSLTLDLESIKTNTPDDRAITEHTDLSAGGSSEGSEGFDGTNAPSDLDQFFSSQASSMDVGGEMGSGPTNRELNTLDSLEDESQLLILAQPDLDLSDEICSHLLSQKTGRQNIIVVTSAGSAPDRVQICQHTGTSSVREIAIVEIGGDGQRLTNQSEVTSRTSDTAITLRQVSSAGNLSRLGIIISQILSDWSASSASSVLCFHCLSRLLQYAEAQVIFRFLHALRGSLQSAGASAHYHLDPSNHDAEVIKTLQPIFDETIRVTESGEIELEK